MKIFLAILATTAAAADHTSLRRALTDPFDQQVIVELSENQNRNEPCIPGEFDRSALVIDAQKKQFPQEVSVGQQCR